MEQNSFHYDANIKIPASIEVKWGEPPTADITPQPERSDVIEFAFMLQPLMIRFADGKESLVFVDFFREQVHAPGLPQKLLDAVTKLIKEKKSNHLPSIPTEIVAESIKRKNSIWNNHQEKFNARKDQFED